MPETFPPHSVENSQIREESALIEEGASSPATEAAQAEDSQLKQLVEADLKRLDWQMGEFEGQPMLVAENISVPEWYQSEGFDVSEHRRPAILMGQRDGRTSYRPAWVFFAERNVHQPLGEVDSIEEAEAIIAKYQQVFSSALSAPDYQHEEEQMMRTDGILRP